MDAVVLHEHDSGERERKMVQRRWAWHAGHEASYIPRASSHRTIKDAVGCYRSGCHSICDYLLPASLELHAANDNRSPIHLRGRTFLVHRQIVYRAHQPTLLGSSPGPAESRNDIKYVTLGSFGVRHYGAPSTICASRPAAPYCT